MNHLTPDELVDAVEDTLASTRVAHVSSCAVCRREVAQLTKILEDTRAVGMSEPSPLFWERFSHRVRAAIDDDRSSRRHLPQWLRWPVAAPLGAMALLLVALVTAVPRDPVRLDTTGFHPPLDAAASITGLDADLAADAAWVLISDLVGGLDIETAQEAGVATAPGTAERAVLQLSAAEQQELVRLLRQELGRAGG